MHEMVLNVNSAFATPTRRPLAPRRSTVARAACRGARQVRRCASANNLRKSPGTEATAHQVSRSIRTIVHTAQAALRWLDSGPANLPEARLALGRIAEHGERLGDIAGSLGSFLRDDGAAHERFFNRNETTPDDFALIGDAVATIRSCAEIAVPRGLHRDRSLGGAALVLGVQLR